MVELLADAPAYIEPKIAVDRTRLAVDPADRALLPASEALSQAHSHHSNDGHSKIGALGIGHGPHFRQKQEAGWGQNPSYNQVATGAGMF